jgi:hypothetical protein
MALTATQQQEVAALLDDIDRLSGLLAAEKIRLADLEAAQDSHG